MIQWGRGKWDPCEFEASMVLRERHRRARLHQQDPVSKTNTPAQPQRKISFSFCNFTTGVFHLRFTASLARQQVPLGPRVPFSFFMNEQAQDYACATPKDPAPREAHPSLLWVTPPSSILIDQWGASCGGGAGSRPARYPAPLVSSPRPPRRAPSRTAAVL